MIPILFLAAEPTEMVRLRVGEEAREIEEKLSRGRFRDRLLLKAHFACTLESLSQAMLDHEPRIVHFAGHGETNGALCFEERNGRAHPVAPQALANFFRLFNHHVECVILNACYSKRQAEAIAEHVDLVIGVEKALEDRAAIKFTVGFYQALAAGRSIAEAFALGRSHVLCGDVLPELAPILLSRRRRSAMDAENAPPRPVTRSRVPGGGKRDPRPEPPRASSPPLEPDPQPVEPAPDPPRQLPDPGSELAHPVDGSELVFVPGGLLKLGAVGPGEWSQPIHRVQIDPFWISRHPVTNEQYARFLAASGHPEPRFWQDPKFNKPRQPVVGVSWSDARAYCQWAGLELPTEAQWEAAARGEDQRPFPWGEEPPNEELANFDNAIGHPTPVDRYPAGIGPFGTLDQAGNVWEWCRDSWHAEAYAERADGHPNPVATGDRSKRVVRGGSWLNPAPDLRSAVRERGSARMRQNIQGFRCSKTYP